jgi:hypothetical protein
VIVSTIPKLSRLPEVRAAVQAIPQIAPFVDAMDGAVAILNQQIRNIAASSNRMAVADFAGLIERIFTTPKFKVGNVRVELNAIDNPTNDPTYFVLGDRLHPGTIGQGLLANLFVKTANDAFGTRLRPLSTHDILQNAGLKREHGRGGAGQPHSTFSIGFTRSNRIGIDVDADDVLTVLPQ